MNLFIPSIFYKGDNGVERSTDIYSRMLQMGIIFCTCPIDSRFVTVLMAQLMYVTYELMLHEVTIYMHSPGGEVYSALSLVNTMFKMKEKKIFIKTIIVGLSASATSILSSCGTTKKEDPKGVGGRFILEYGQMMIHEPIGNTGRGSTTSIRVYSKEITRLRKTLSELYEKNSTTGVTAKDFCKHMKVDNYLVPQRVLELGLVDKII